MGWFGAVWVFQLQHTIATDSVVSGEVIPWLQDQNKSQG